MDRLQLLQLFRLQPSLTFEFFAVFDGQHGSAAVGGEESGRTGTDDLFGLKVGCRAVRPEAAELE